MSMKKIIPVVAIISVLLSSCTKEINLDDISFSNYPVLEGFHVRDTILVDASRDGGVWWYPQDGTFNPSIDHQGTALVNYLGSLGHIVEELPRGATITRDLLRRYDLVIRAGEYGTYTADEIAAYQEFLRRNSALLLATDHSAQLQNDQLATYLGLPFEGSYTTDIIKFNPHPITQGVTTHQYIAGSVIRNPDLNKIIPLGYFSDATITNATAMGIVIHPSSRIFFIGDLNGLEAVPQPLTKNVMKWLTH